MRGVEKGEGEGEGGEVMMGYDRNEKMMMRGSCANETMF